MLTQIRKALVALLLSAASASAAVAQSGDSTPGWHWKLDRPATRTSESVVPDTAWRFDQMAPGWHLTTGPAGIFYPGEQASGLFSLTADFVVFPRTSDSGFGIFLGGSALESDTASYVSAFLRRDGAVSIVRTVRGTHSTLVPWTRHDAIKPHTGSGVVTNRMRVNASADSLRVFVNDSSVVRIPLENSALSGQFGFDIGERVNLHLTILDHTRHLAPARSR